MVIQTKSEVPLECPIPKQNMESKKYIVVKNHVREITEEDIQSDLKESNIKERKSKKHKKQTPSTDDNIKDTSEISKSDIEELKKVYKKCKNVLMTIESKYGHLLNLENENAYTDKGNRKRDISGNQCQCSCTPNKKIIFNDNGPQVYEGGSLQNHICRKKPKTYEKQFTESYCNIQIEHETSYNNQPESILELTELLKNPLIETNTRNSIISKIKDIRQESLNIIRFDRNKIIQNLKSNPEDVFEFKGSNLSSLEGYPDKQIHN